MFVHIETALGDLNLNIAEMTNVSRGDIAYNLIDIENAVDEKSISSLKSIEEIGINCKTWLSSKMSWRENILIKPKMERNKPRENQS